MCLAPSQVLAEDRGSVCCILCIIMLSYPGFPCSDFLLHSLSSPSPASCSIPVIKPLPLRCTRCFMPSPACVRQIRMAFLGPSHPFHPPKRVFFPVTGSDKVYDDDRGSTANPVARVLSVHLISHIMACVPTLHLNQAPSA